MNIDRENVNQRNIIQYSFPSLSINFKNEGNINFGTIDVRSLLFLPGNSFFFFYTDSHTYRIDNNLMLRDLKRKNDEPVIYFLEKERKYLITNSWESISRYNKYIGIVLRLSLHYLNVFENWLLLLLEGKR